MASSFGVELGRLMFERQTTFRELSRRTGLAPPTLNHYANDRRRPADETILLLARALEVEPEAFFEWRRREVLGRVGSSEQLVEALWTRLQAS